MAYAIVSVLLDKVVTFLVTEGRQLLEFEDQFGEIRKEFQYMQKYIKDADRVKRRDRTETVKMIMNDLRELIYDVEDIIADCQLLSQKKKHGWAPNSLSPERLKSRYLLGKKLRNTNKRIQVVKQNMASYLATVPLHGKKEVGKNIPLTYPILMTGDSTVGLEDESSEIINWLLVKNEYLKVIGMVGMGGIGKTTLALKIFKSGIIETEFKHLIFVAVSQSFKFDELLKKMLRKQHVADELLTGKGVDDLLEILQNELDDKYLIVLDDVWGVDEGQWWDSLASALPKDKGGRVIVTTRNEDVARSMGVSEVHMYRAETLSEQSSWSLFCKVAFAGNGGICPNAELENCGKEIIAQCGGLPLTIKTVAGMMLGKGNSIDEWGRISKHLKEEMASSNKDELVISRLELSYEELPMHLRPCLLCFAMYPEDFSLATFQVINTWIAEGFVWGRRGKTVSKIGEEWLNELHNRCLILRDDEELFGSGLSFYKVHDAVREMLIKITREEGFFSMNRGDGPTPSVLSRRAVMFEKIAPESIENNCAKLRTLVVSDAEMKDATPMLAANLQKLRRLRTLFLSLSSANTATERVESPKWLRGIDLLQHLVYLHLDNIGALRTLPDSIGNLRNLQILSIANCSNLERLPPSITTLEKLIAFSVIGCESIKCLPKGLGKLSNLEQLTCLKADDEDTAGYAISFAELKKLTKLRLLALEISEEEQIGEEECNALEMPESLQILNLVFSGFTSVSAAGIARKIDRPLSHSLQSLKELYLCNYLGESTPTWLSPTSVPNLRFLSIYCGSIKNMSSAFWSDCGAWKVETLELVRLNSLEDDWETIERAMPFLRLASVTDCPKLKYSEEAFQPGPHNCRIWKKRNRGESSSSSQLLE